QVKIRGFRIEAGEIENRLAAHENVKEAVVSARKDGKGDGYLCAYISLAETAEATHSEGDTAAQLREYLAAELPRYMIPAYFIILDKIPLTTSGKVNRKELPEPGTAPAGPAYKEPETILEKRITVIWSEILAIEKQRIGIDTEFFELGGHSLSANRLVARIHKELNVEVPLEVIFKTPTIRALSRYIQGAEKEKFLRIEPVEEREYYPLSRAQARMYVLKETDPASTDYNMPQVMTWEGELDKTKLEKTFRDLIHRHESLRTSFRSIKGEPVQVIHRDAAFRIEYFGLGDNPLTKAPLDSTLLRPFDLEKAPLLRVVLIEQEQSKYNLLVDIHHIAADGISSDIIARDFFALYKGDRPPTLSSRYRDYAQWQKGLLESEALKKQETYWLKRFEGGVPETELPVSNAGAGDGRPGEGAGKRLI
ncbi:MAG: non-ribosomal peptide synthetase, partial [bacterium]|nr:non-ribosomal peptide synthetase [bacterium]